MMEWGIPILGNPHINIIMGSMRLIFTHQKKCFPPKDDLHLHTMFFVSQLADGCHDYLSKQENRFQGSKQQDMFFSPTE